MTRVGPVGVMLGVALVVIGLVTQVVGMSAWVYCSVVGIGLVVAIVAGAIWVVQARRHGTPGAFAA